jgi:hypothetical protein
LGLAQLTFVVSIGFVLCMFTPHSSKSLDNVFSKVTSSSIEVDCAVGSSVFVVAVVVAAVTAVADVVVDVAGVRQHSRS